LSLSFRFKNNSQWFSNWNKSLHLIITLSIWIW